MTKNMSYTLNKPKTSATLNPMHNIHQNCVCLKTCLNFFAYKYSKKTQQEQLNKYACCHQNKCTYSIVVQLCLWFVFFCVGHSLPEKQIQSSWIHGAVLGEAVCHHQWLWYSGCSWPLHWEVIAILQAHTYTSH